MSITVISLLTMVGIVTYISHRNIKQIKREIKLLGKSRDRLQKENQAICSNLLALGQEIEGLRSEYKKYWSKPSAAKTGLESPSYTHATKLLEKGASVKEVQDSCKLTRQEAELLAILQGKRPQSISQ